MGNPISYFMGVTFTLIMIMFIVDLSMTNVAVSEGFNAPTDFFNYSTSQIKQFDTGSYTLTEDVTAVLPSSTQNTVDDDDSGNIFTDTFVTFKNWLLDLSGITFIISIVNTLPTLLTYVFQGELQPIAFGLGYLWFVSFVASLIFWLKGGSS